MSHVGPDSGDWPSLQVHTSSRQDPSQSLALLCSSGDGPCRTQAPVMINSLPPMRIACDALDLGPQSAHRQEELLWANACSNAFLAVRAADREQSRARKTEFRLASKARRQSDCRAPRDDRSHMRGESGQKRGRTTPGRSLVPFSYFLAKAMEYFGPVHGNESHGERIPGVR